MFQPLSPKNKRRLARLQLLAMAALPLVLLLLPADSLDGERSICLSQRLAGVQCYGCGMGRACLHLIHGDFSEAWQFNRLSFLVLPILVFLYAESGWQAWQKAKFNFGPRH